MKCYSFIRFTAAAATTTAIAILLLSQGSLSKPSPQDVHGVDPNTIGTGGGVSTRSLNSTRKFVTKRQNLPSIEERKNAVVNAMKHAWSGYYKYAAKYDELLPLSKKGDNTWKMTAIDSIDTLHIMGLKEEYAQARESVLSVDFTKTDDGFKTSFFESTIRAVGGLISIHELTNDKGFLDKAQQLGDILMRAFKTPTGLPYREIDVNNIWKEQETDNTSTSLADVGTCIMEYKRLSDLTNKQIYNQNAQKAFDKIASLETKVPGLFPVQIDAKDGKTFGPYSFGAMGDSYYEYLLKYYLMTGKTETKYRDMYIKAIEAVNANILRNSLGTKPLLYIGQLSGKDDHKFEGIFQHLTCFAPGLYALGAKELERPGDLEIAISLMDTCYQLYMRTNTGLSPEAVLFAKSEDQAAGITPTQALKDIGVTFDERLNVHNVDSEYHAINPAYLLRPEVVESLMVLYRVTDNTVYQDWGWNIFQAIEKYTKVKEGGYATYANVYNQDIGDSQEDEMPSFFLAEALKYLFLLFSPKTDYSLDEYVFNTEAHPFRIKKP
ncbi:Endoplasmic reticulum mannosyl-oligosaccharide 1,2-alpha-mannosidase [Mycoemilia scoparia]|uniref:alpha-1,2-Mannosidase n=1 Tax=Mycoemilia scoparia TaxID=417184 RepID=A0A9W8A292_9FUNG|nr:Endoplasmic reticulum mannosyl-oligosaccharide 1,2-alpha-mannosidase [Mycoemilia scoparia]